MFGPESFVRRHPRVTATLAVGSAAVIFGVQGHNSAPSTEGGGKTSAVHGTAAANKNPRSSQLACELVLREAGANFTLQTDITEGTPPAGAHLTYSPKYQDGLSGGFKSHRTGPVSVEWQQTPSIPGVDQNQPLVSVRGDIGQTHCTPILVGEGQ